MIIEEIVIKHLINNGYIASAEALANGVDEYIVVEKPDQMIVTILKEQPLLFNHIRLVFIKLLA